MWIQNVFNSEFPKNYKKEIEYKRRIKHKVKSFIETKQNKINKAIQLALKKAVTKSIKTESFKKQTWNINQFKKIINILLNDKIFAQANIKSYSDFLKSLSLNSIFAPQYVKSSLIRLYIDLNKWKNLYLKEILAKKTEQKTHLAKLSQWSVKSTQIKAPLNEIKQKLINRNILTKKNKPKAVNKILFLSDDAIISWFRTTGQSLLNYYRCCDNFYRIKSYVDYFIRWSAIQTFAKKHKKSSIQIINIYSKNLSVFNINGIKTVSFLSSIEIKELNKEFLINIDYNFKTLNNKWIKYIKIKTKI